jgi:hypothetical protein
MLFAAAAILLSASAAAASPLSIFGTSVSSSSQGAPTFCLPTTGSYHLRLSSISAQGPAGGTAARAIFESSVDFNAGKERLDLSDAPGAFAPTLRSTTIIDYNAGFAWDYNVKAKTCRKTAAPPRPTPDSQCGAPDGVTYAGAGTQGPISTTIYTSVADFNGKNSTRKWYVAGDVPVFDSLLHFSSSFENATWAAYERTEFEDYVRRRSAARAAGHVARLHPHAPLPPSRQSRAPIAPAVFVLPPECPK